MCCIVALIFFFSEMRLNCLFHEQSHTNRCVDLSNKRIRICFNCFIRLCEVYTCSTNWYFLVILRSNCNTDVCPHIEGGVVPPIGIQDNWK